MLQELFKKDCYMLDIETTGLSAITNGITSIALVKFNFNTDVPHKIIQDYLQFRISTAINVDLLRTVDVETAKFRQKAGINLAESKLPVVHMLVDIIKAINGFVGAAKNSKENKHVFALHTEFDIAFLRGYFEAAEWDFTFNHRNVWEITSLIKGMSLDYQDMKLELEESAIWSKINQSLQIEDFIPHNALYDCVKQILVLRQACLNSGVI